MGDEFETLDQLKAKIREQLDQGAKNKTESEAREAAIQALIVKNPFEVPQSLVDRAAEQIAADRLSRLPEQQAEIIWQAQGVRLKEEARPLALKQVRAGLILEELVKQEKLEVTEADLDARFEELAAEVGSTSKVVRQVYKKNKQTEQLQFQIGTNRMLARVIENAKVTESQKGFFG